jgi:hypothetical protein
MYRGQSISPSLQHPRSLSQTLSANAGMQRVCKKLGFALNYDNFADDMKAEITL